MKLKHKKQDLFKVNPNNVVFAHCIAKDLKYGAGIAKEFAKQHPSMRADLRNKYPDLGDAVKHTSNYRTIYNLITKEISTRKPTGYYYLIRALDNLKKQMVENEEKYLVIPLIGAGLDRLDWDKIQEIIIKTFKDTEIKILVCHLNSVSSDYKDFEN
jgi:O-acetyl-ADP-ribose deacetylase (regulator of RNase III)